MAREEQDDSDSYESREYGAAIPLPPRRYAPSSETDINEEQFRPSAQERAAAASGTIEDRPGLEEAPASRADAGSRASDEVILEPAEDNNGELAEALAQAVVGGGEGVLRKWRTKR